MEDPTDLLEQTWEVYIRKVAQDAKGTNPVYIDAATCNQEDGSLVFRDINHITVMIYAPGTWVTAELYDDED